MKKRFVVLVLDGFGMRAMEDAHLFREQDQASSTFGSILRTYPALKLPNLEKLGLMNAYGMESATMKFSDAAIFSTSRLMHFGADTYAGHQEIMGTKPQKPTIQPFQEVIHDVASHLTMHGHLVEWREKEGLQYLLVDHYVCVADNIDADYGQAYNVTAPLDLIPFADVLQIGKLVRQKAKVSRVIPFGGTNTTLNDILAAEEVHLGKFIGIHAVKSKSYEHGYQVLHLGYGVNDEVQVPVILGKQKIAVSLFGKVADIVSNPYGKSVSCVNTNDVMDLTIQELREMEQGFICTNVQETDLAGHSQNPGWYKDLLVQVDEKLNILLPLLTEEDILVIMADHGNDPLIGHNKHTRECVPLLIYDQQHQTIEIPQRSTLSDVGATACEFFGAHSCENGTSFLSFLK